MNAFLDFNLKPNDDGVILLPFDESEFPTADSSEQPAEDIWQNAFKKLQEYEKLINKRLMQEEWGY